MSPIVSYTVGDIAFVEKIMTGYDSPIGKKQFQGQPFKEVTIPDESVQSPQNQSPQGVRPQQPSQYAFQMDEAALRDFNARYGPPQEPMPTREQADLEQQFREAREAKKLGRERLSEGARRRIEMLVGMTNHTRSFEVGSNIYVLRTLRDRELRDAIIAATAFDGSVQSPFEIRKQLLARSLVQIAGMDANQFMGSSAVEDKLAGLEEFDHYLLGRLYDEYLSMVKEAQAKYAVQTQEQAQEVVEDLKK